jgi:uncharacterized protein (DUF4415 family)
MDNRIYMKRKKRVGKGIKSARKVKRIQASAVMGRPFGRLRAASRALPEELVGLYRPVKKAVTLRLDADILAWFQRGGRGYQTRINRALRQLMTDERKGARG